MKIFSVLSFPLFLAGCIATSGTDLQSGANLERQTSAGIAGAFFKTTTAQIEASPSRVKSNLQNMLNTCVNGQEIVAEMRGMQNGFATSRIDKYAHTGSFSNEDGVERMVIVTRYSASGSWARYQPTASMSVRIEPLESGTQLTIRHLKTDKSLPEGTIRWASGSASGCPDLTKSHVLGAF